MGVLKKRFRKNIPNGRDNVPKDPVYRKVDEVLIGHVEPAVLFDGGLNDLSVFQ